jgi:hypothetical protein
MELSMSPNFDEPGHFLDVGSEEYLLVVRAARDRAFKRWEESGYIDYQFYHSYLAWKEIAEGLEQ